MLIVTNLQDTAIGTQIKGLKPRSISDISGQVNDPKVGVWFLAHNSAKIDHVKSKFKQNRIPHIKPRRIIYFVFGKDQSQG